MKSSEHGLVRDFNINGYQYNTGFIHLLYDGQIQFSISITPLGLGEIKDEEVLGSDD